MKKMLNYIKFAVKKFFSGSSGAVSNFIFVLTPFVSFFVGWYSGINKGDDFYLGGEIILVTSLVIIAVILRVYSVANSAAVGGMPIPAKRFTIDAGGGEIQVETDRLQELILYTADLEDWLDVMGYSDVEESEDSATER